MEATDLEQNDVDISRVPNSPTSSPIKRYFSYPSEENIVALMKDLHDLTASNTLASNLANTASLQKLDNVLGQLLHSCDKSKDFPIHNLTRTEENRLKIRQLGGLLPLLYLIMPNVATPVVRQASGLLHYLSADGML